MRRVAVEGNLALLSMPAVDWLGDTTSSEWAKGGQGVEAPSGGGSLASSEVEKCLHRQKDGLLITNGEGVGLWVNTAMKQVVGLTPDYFLYKPIRHLFERGIFQYQAVTERARCCKNELTDIQAVNTGNTVLVTSIPIIGEKDNIEYMVTTVRNLAQLRWFPAAGESLAGDSQEPDLLLQRLGLVYRSQAMRRIVELAARVARTEATVLITGETGVGKELIARLIHELSPRRDKPFLRINCAALPRELAESELFGYEPGAFTGARAAGKAGLFEAANGGTILLDEVGELPPDMQAKLLRVLQEQEVLRLGGTRTMPINVRVLAATNADLQALVEQRRFRPDLYYRLNVVAIDIPPLRERPEDVPLLLGHYLRFYCEKYNVRRRFALEAFKALLRYDWPGNVRELANLVHRLVLVSSGTEITPDLLPPYITGEADQAPEGVGRFFSTCTALLGHGSLRQILEDVEKEIIAAALRDSQGVRDASRRLGIPHPTLINKIRKYGLSGPGRPKA